MQEPGLATLLAAQNRAWAAIFTGTFHTLIKKGLLTEETVREILNSVREAGNANRAAVPPGKDSDLHIDSLTAQSIDSCAGMIEDWLSASSEKR